MDSESHHPQQDLPTKPYLTERIVTVLALALMFLCGLLLILIRPQPQLLRTVRCEGQVPEAASQSPDGHFVVGQVIVIGPAGRIDALVTQELSETLEPAALSSCDISYVGQLPDLSRADANEVPFTPDDLNTLSVRLYQIKTTTTVTQAVDAVNNAGQGNRVFGDPNYLTTRMVDAESCGSPNSDGGSPNSDGGSPLSGAGPQTPQELFAKQWAFEHIAIGRTLQDSYRAATVNFAGGGVRGGVFDTSPYMDTFPSGEDSTISKTVDWLAPAFPALRLTVHSTTLPLITPSQVLSDVSDHGLFVAGLIHAMAPETDIHLYPVLGKYGCGDLFTLVTALHRYINQVQQDRDGLHGAVINLSLGVLKPRDKAASTETPGGIDAQAVQTPQDELDQALDILEKDDVESLLLTMHAAYKLDIVVVAAAGNDSWHDEDRDRPRAPQLPAAYPFVIGVAGSTANRQRSCFSNWGDVSAPAGEGAPGIVTTVITTTSVITTSIPTLCAARPELDKCSGDCAMAVIGPVLKRDPSDTGFVYWSGTSFATPLVSGLAVLTQQAGAVPSPSAENPTAYTWMPPSEVAQAIKCGAATADGVINVPTTLMRCIKRSSP